MSTFSDHINRSKYNLILYPPTIRKSQICSNIIIMPFFVGKDLLIMTNNKSDINNKLPGKLPDGFYTEYEINKKIQKISQSDAKYLIVDDVNSFIKSNIWDSIGHCNVILIATLGLRSKDVLYLNKLNLQILNINLADMGPVLEYNVYVQQNELNNTISTEKILDTEMKNILSIILLSSNTDKHVIYTKDIEEFIYNYKSYFTDMRKKYIDISDDNSIEHINESYDKFNDSNIGLILITSICPDRNLRNVSHIHFTVDFEYLIYYNFIQYIYIKNLYTSPIGKLSIYFHLSSQLDIDNYKEIKKIFYDEQYQYYHLLKKSMFITQ